MNQVSQKFLIGFDMGGTSTDVSRFDGINTAMSYETQIDGIDLQVPHLQIGIFFVNLKNNKFIPKKLKIIIFRNCCCWRRKQIIF